MRELNHFAKVKENTYILIYNAYCDRSLEGRNYQLSDYSIDKNTKSNSFALMCMKQSTEKKLSLKKTTFSISSRISSPSEEHESY